MRSGGIIPWWGDSALGEGVEGRGEAFEGGAERGRVAADADAEMARHFEEAAGNDSGFKFFAEQLEEGFGVAAVREAREDDRACGGTKTFEVAVRVEEGIEQGAIGGEERAGAFAEFLEMIEGHDGEALRGVRAGGGEEIVEEPYTAGKAGSGENPAAAQAAETINLGEAAGDDKGVLLAEAMELPMGKQNGAGLPKSISR